jgi:hypothetical protein
MMQRTLFGEPLPSTVKVPMLVIRAVDADCIAVHFKDVGSDQRFEFVRQQFKTHFPLAIYTKQRRCWILVATQRIKVKEFGEAVGMKVVEES